MLPSFFLWKVAFILILSPSKNGRAALMNHPLFPQIITCFSLLSQNEQLTCLSHELLSPFRKTNKNKRIQNKTFVFLCFYWFCSVFLDGESNHYSLSIINYQLSIINQCLRSCNLKSLQTAIIRRTTVENVVTTT